MYLKEFDLDLPYIVDDENIESIIKKQKCEYNEATSRIEDGIWKVIGNAPIPRMTFPMYKEETEDGYTLVDHKGDIVTETPSASQIEVASELESWSPVSLEKAVIARFVTGEWDPYYNDLIYIE
ncbi:hypothetical protein PAEAM_23270 [Paenibacillus sp. GM1FR]|uniref:hypothetical protein n=1 Tax=Paenibacillus sp. GM1FR TaxID=2059267 RepID=UPI000C27E95E|nr:hypothetical protein [Paenibacillus sp. GM1FR]PJN62764.1 hypothetical protein PAEAM_23270 [Paenibacillus sp. GM1FR]